MKPRLRPHAWAARVMLAAAFVAALAGCGARNPHFDPARAHHTPEGFRNPNDVANPGFAAFLRWKWDRLWQAMAPDNPGRVPVTALDPSALHKPESGWRVSWIGHATVLLQIDGLNLITDPVFSPRPAPLSGTGAERLVPLPLRLDDLPPIDAVLISHNHYDHLDEPTLRALFGRGGGRTRFLVPLGVERWFAEQGIGPVTALDWWRGATIARNGDAVDIDLVPAQHWSRRTLADTNRTLWGGYVVRGGGVSAYFAGDTGYGPHFGEIGRRYGGFDLAMIPVGCHEPRWFMGKQHVNPAEAARAHLDLGARYTLGIHWGTFRHCDEPADQPLDDLPPALARSGIPPDRFELWAIGERRRLAGNGFRR
ncbi:MAG: MBL fold metallo-hydrolase [Candidatus Nitricoxidivorans perseverans]|uniref:MBL fold metallo-hydrolase n=1 Tax=Candidatus Nitricoxidivorans perseverans TaxID=2975601 RepID=A0AA49IYT3_9PROT|nr:MAG: MBL fold metallo-hydrolase [Candidatus Nitricoxidivorans perseverans]